MVELRRLNISFVFLNRLGVILIFMAHLLGLAGIIWSLNNFIFYQQLLSMAGLLLIVNLYLKIECISMSVGE